jgi:hypothetical protein
MALTTPIEPLHPETYGAAEELVPTGRSPVHSVVIGVPPALALQPRKQPTEPQMPGLLTPRRTALQGVPYLLARGAAFERLFARPILAPMKRKPETRNPR